MKKLIFSVVLLLAAMLTFAACNFGGGSDDTNSNQNNNDNNQDTHECVRTESEIYMTSEPCCRYEGSGYKIVFCDECGYEFERIDVTIEKLPHTPGAVETGYDVYDPCADTRTFYDITRCSECFEEMSRVERVVQVTPRHGEIATLFENVIEPTCIADGSRDEIGVCQICHNVISRKNVIIEKIPHTPAKAVEENVNAPTCKSEGSCELVVYCANEYCHEELSRVPTVLGITKHVPRDAIKENEIKATCTQSGSYDSVVYCDICSDELSRTSVNVPKTHQLDEYGICINCDMNASRGLVFTENSGGAVLTGRGTFKGDKLIIPSMYNGNPVKAINTLDFSNDTSLVSVTIPPEVKSINSGAFVGCIRLVEVINLSEKMSITAGSTSHGRVAANAIEVHSGTSNIGYSGKFLFYTYNEVNYLIKYTGESTYVELPEYYFTQKYEIYKNAFSGRSDITDVIIPNSVTKIGDFAFGGCIALMRVVIPYDVAPFSTNVFSSSHMEELQIPVTLLSCIQNKGNLKKVTVTRGSSNAAIPADAFKNCTYLQTVEIGHGVYGIGDGAFSGCTSLVSVSLSSSVSSIGAGAFGNCIRLAEIINNSGLNITVGSDTLGGIGKYAIEVHGGKTKISVVDGYVFLVTESMNYLLLYAGKKTELIVPTDCNGAAYVIHNNAFKDCVRIVSIQMYGSITSIGNYAFSGCTKLGYIAIGASVESIGVGAFDAAPAVKSITVEKANTVYMSLDYNLYSKNGKTLIKYTVGSTSSSFTVPGGVEEISVGAFEGAKSLKSVIIAKSVKTIGDRAFFGCNALSSLLFEENSEILAIGENVFTNCVLRTVAIPMAAVSRVPLAAVVDMTINGGSEIPDSTFVNLTNLKSLTIGKCVTVIGKNAFSGCTSLVNVTVGEGVTSIGESAFDGCVSVIRVYVINITKWYTITFGNEHSNPLSYKAGLYVNGNIVRDLVVPGNISRVSSYAFYGCSSINTLVLSDGVQGVGTGTFRNCEFLVSVEVSESFRSIAIDSFFGCLRLIEIVNNSSLYFGGGSESNGYIAYYATSVHPGESGIFKVDDYIFFKYNLYTKYFVTYVGHVDENTEIVIPELDDGAAYTIRQYAFYKFGDMKSIAIPESVKGAETYSFHHCSFESATLPTTVVESNAFPTGKLKHLTINGGDIISEDRFASHSLLESLVIGDSVTSIGDGAFLGCTSLKSVIIGNGITAISGAMFYNCTALESISMGSGITAIGGSAFYGCSSLKTVTIPKTTTVIHPNAFNSCTSLAKIEFEQNCYLEIIYERAFYGCSALAELKIPRMLKYIHPYAFAECDSLASVEFGSSSPVIYNDAFSASENIESVSVDDISVWLTISFESEKSNPLMYAKKLYVGENLISDVVVPEGTEQIKKYAFYNSDSLKSVTLPEGLTTISAYSFYGCGALEEITLPKTLVYIYDYAFYRCSNLKQIDIPASVNTIGQSAFASCRSIKELYIPTGVKYISNSAFAGCTSLYRVVLGDNIRSVGEWAFRNCDNLMSVEIGNTFGPIYDEAFSSCYSLVEIINHSQRTFTIGSSYEGEIALRALIIHTGESKLVNKDGYIFYTHNGENLLIGYVGDETDLVLPENYNGENYAIHSYAFRDNDKITSVVISDGVTKIGASAFSDCYKMKSVVIGENVTQIGSAFIRCSGLESVEFKSPEGWTVNKNEVSGLSDKTLAAEYLKNTYAYGFWEKAE